MIKVGADIEIAMFGMIIASGIRTLGKVEFEGNYNLMLVGISIGVAMIPLAVPGFYHNFPKEAQIVLHSGITFGSIVAVLLNLILNGPAQETTEEAMEKVKAFDRDAFDASHTDKE